MPVRGPFGEIVQVDWTVMPPQFMKLWNDHTVAEALNDGQPIVREHPEVGTFTFRPLDLYFHRRDDISLRLFFPADEATTRRLAALQGRGTPFL
jgi:hypothetical protein